jgi:hypothetical protein
MTLRSARTVTRKRTARIKTVAPTARNIFTNCDYAVIAYQFVSLTTVFLRLASQEWLTSVHVTSPFEVPPALAAVSNCKFLRREPPLESLFLSPGRIRKVAIALRPSTLLAFHQALVRWKYRRLFSSTPRPKKPGPTGPSTALIQAIVELKSRIPRFGCIRRRRGLRRWVGGSQIDSKAALSAQTRFPAITVPAGSTPGGFPVGIGLLGRPLAETAPGSRPIWAMSTQNGPFRLAATL